MGPALDIDYPETDGLPMADNTIQYDWIVRLVDELRLLLAGQDVFVAGNLFWYPVEGQPKIVTAPDAMVIFGRPPGNRPSYKQWLEGGIAPQVTFEVLSPGNTDDELDEALAFYERHGVDEYYLIDPYEYAVTGYRRRDRRLTQIRKMNGYVSPRLGIRFEVTDDAIHIFRPDGREFQNRPEREEFLLRELDAVNYAAKAERERAVAAERDLQAALARAADLEAELARLRGA